MNNQSEKAVTDGSVAVRNPRIAGKTKPTPRAWRAAYEEGLEASGYTGEVIWKAHYNQGVLTKLVPFKQDISSK